MKMTPETFAFLNELKTETWNPCLALMKAAATSSSFVKQDSNVRLLAGLYSITETALALLQRLVTDICSIHRIFDEDYPLGEALYVVVNAVKDGDLLLLPWNMKTVINETYLGLQDTDAEDGAETHYRHNYRGSLYEYVEENEGLEANMFMLSNLSYVRMADAFFANKAMESALLYYRQNNIGALSKYYPVMGQILNTLHAPRPKWSRWCFRLSTGRP